MKIITGMHRSGTSMTSNMLMEISGQENFPEEHIKSDHWNQKGYFENKEIVVLNNTILISKYAPSSQIINDPDIENKKLKKALLGIFNFKYVFILLNPNSIHRSAQRYQNEISTISTKYQSHIIKDPRFSLLLSPWREWGNIEKVLVCFRDPKEVALSLKKRNKLPMQAGYWLWKFHNNQLLKSIEEYEDHQVIYIYYNNFFHPQKRETEIQRLYAFLDIPFDDRQAQHLLENILDSNLKHYTSNATSPVASPPSVIIQVQIIKTGGQNHDPRQPLHL
jgi:hypothetical protein